MNDPIRHDDRLLTVMAVARRLQTPLEEVYGLIRQGRLVAFDIGVIGIGRGSPHLRVTERHLKAFLQARKGSS